MLVRFFSHGKVKKGELSRTGGGGAVRNYLLFDKDDKTKLREGARLIYGNDIDTTEIINGIKNSKIYTSGVLSFAPEESITESQKIEIIESFEQNLFLGLMRGEYSGYWVEHRDKDRQELHFVFADIHLPTGKALPVFYHGKDLKLVDSWKDLINIDYGLEDPNSCKHQRPYQLKGHEYAQKKQQEQDKLAGKKIEKPKEFIEEKIGEWLIEEILDDESIQTQDDIIRKLSEEFEITRVAKDGKSISIKNPEGGRNIKLKGIMYERNFTREHFESLGKTQARERANRSELKAINNTEREKRFNRLRSRFGRAATNTARQILANRPVIFSHIEPRLDARFQQSPLRYRGAQYPVGATSRDAQTAKNRHTDLTNQSIVNQGRITSTVSDHPEHQRFDGATKSANTQRAASAKPTSHVEQSDSLSQVLSDTRSQAGKQPSQVLSGELGISSDNTLDIGWQWRGYVLYGNPNRSKTREQEPNRTADTDSATTARANQSENSAITPRRSGSVHGGDIAERPESDRDTHHSEESSDRRVRQESQRQVSIGSNPSQSVFAQELNKELGKPPNTDIDNIILDNPNDPANPYRAYHHKLRKTIERFAPENRQQADADKNRLAATTHPNDFTVSDELIRTIIEQTADQAIESSRPRATTEDPTTQSANQRVLGRISRATKVRDSNTRRRQERISALTTKNTNSLDQIGEHLSHRRQRNQEFAQGFTTIGDQFTDIYTRERNRRQWLKRHCNQLADTEQHLNTASNELNAAAAALLKLFDTRRKVFKAVKESFVAAFDDLKQQAMGYADQGILYHSNPDGSRGAKATKQEAEDFIHSHPYDLDNYNSLSMTVQKWDREKKKSQEYDIRGPGL